jgi:NAD(P)-dependent dehydrogenase (short-subunit alcohol dehydrogenase family)
MALDGKVVLITGGAGALGQTVTPAFVKAGATVVILDRHPPDHLPAGQLAIAADVIDHGSVQRAVTEVIQKAGRLDILMNLVGGFALGRVEDTDVSVWQQMLSMNLTSAFLLSKAVIPPMRRQGAGRILHIAARAAMDPFPGAAAYIVGKSGLMAFIRVLAIELAGSGITVNGVLPTTIDTPANRTNMPTADFSKWVTPDSIARLLVFLASDDARDVNGGLIPIGPT